MKTAAIICEYNPFHYGHKFHMNETRRILGEDTAVLSLMSGNFVQRGLPAYEDKWFRAKQAVMMGSDLVIELPFVYACNGARQFAQGAVKILDSLKCVDYLSFGSESGDIDEIRKHIGEDREQIEMARSGVSYAKAFGNDEFMKHPNNILSVEYLRALAAAGSSIVPVTVRRSSHESSSFIRSECAAGRDISGYMPLPYEGYTGGIPYDIVAFAVLSHTAEEIDSLPSAGEGIGFKLRSEIRYHRDTHSLVDAVRQSRYTKARINRVLCQLVAGADSSDAVRILAVGKHGGYLIRKMKKSGVKVITNINKEKGTGAADIKASDVYNIIRGRDLYEESDYVRKPYIAIEKK